MNAPPRKHDAPVGGASVEQVGQARADSSRKPTATERARQEKPWVVTLRSGGRGTHVRYATEAEAQQLRAHRFAASVQNVAQEATRRAKAKVQR